MKQLLTIIPDPTGQVLMFIEHLPLEKVTYLSKIAVDNDGVGSSHGDPCHQNETSYKRNGKSLNSDIDAYGVVNPSIIRLTKGKVMGCRGTATNLTNGRSTDFIVGDVGPGDKAGEGSDALNEALGLSDNPFSGGTEHHVILWEIYPGQMFDES